MSALRERNMSTGMPASSSWLLIKVPRMALGTLVTMVQRGSSLGSNLPLISSRPGRASMGLPQSGHTFTHAWYSYPHVGHRKACSDAIYSIIPQPGGSDDGRWTMDDGQYSGQTAI